MSIPCWFDCENDFFIGVIDRYDYCSVIEKLNLQVIINTMDRKIFEIKYRLYHSDEYLEGFIECFMEKFKINSKYVEIFPNLLNYYEFELKMKEQKEKLKNIIFHLNTNYTQFYFYEDCRVDEDYKDSFFCEKENIGYGKYKYYFYSEYIDYECGKRLNERIKPIIQCLTETQLLFEIATIKEIPEDICKNILNYI